MGEAVASGVADGVTFPSGLATGDGSATSVGEGDDDGWAVADGEGDEVGTACDDAGAEGPASRRTTGAFAAGTAAATTAVEAARPGGR